MRQHQTTLTIHHDASILSLLLLFLFVVLQSVEGRSQQQSFANSPSGACCMKYSLLAKTRCYEYSRDECEEVQGDYIGDFVRCTAHHPCLGACCTRKGCKEVIEWECESLDGVWTRAGTRCHDTVNVCNATLVGGCCYKKDLQNNYNFGSCRVESFVDCYKGTRHPKGYFWTPGSDCYIPAICPFLLVPYVEPLPIPLTLQPRIGKSGCQGVIDGDYSVQTVPQPQKVARTEYVINATQFEHKYYPFFPNPQVAFGYEGSYPGPIIEACQGVPISIQYYNYLPLLPHPLGFDSCPHGPNFLPDVPYTSLHLHGGKNPPRFDGWPEALVFPDDSYLYFYENIQNCSSALFYHDQAIGIARKNVMMGLTGIYNVRSVDDPMLPEGSFEIPLFIQDRSFSYTNGTVDLYYPANYDVALPFPSDDFTGTVVVVNGVVMPYLEVSPSQYRLRITNAATSRTFTFNFVKVIDGGSIEEVPFFIIGSDQSFLVTPQLVDDISLSPAERADIIFDFSHFESGDKLWLINSAPFPFPNGNSRAAQYVAVSSRWTPIEVMEFRVSGISAPKITLPLHLLENYSRLPISGVRSVRSFLTVPSSRRPPAPGAAECLSTPGWVFRRFKSDGDPSKGFLDQPGWDALNYITQDFILSIDTTEIWEFWNPAQEAQPIHLHGFKFQILSINEIVWNKVDMETMNMSSSINFEPIQLAWKDTVKILPLSVTRLIILFDQYQGKYPLHCSIMEHEDSEMISQFRVVDPSRPCELRSGSACGNKICEAANGENCLNCPLDCLSGPSFCCGYEKPVLETEYLQSSVVLPIVQMEPLVNNNSTNFIGCGPARQLKPGEIRLCQRLEEGSQFLLSVSCRTDYVDSCCGDNWCEQLKGEFASCPEDCDYAPTFGMRAREWS